MTATEGTLLRGRRGLVLGVANERSLATGIARAASAQGATLLLGVQNERFLPRGEEIARAIDARGVVCCDLNRDEELPRLAEAVERELGALDFLVHAVAYAPPRALTGRFVHTERAHFAATLESSTYSLIAACQTLLPFLEKGNDPSVLTLTYLGAERTVPGYNVMGVAKAALEATVRSLAADLGPQGIRVNALSPGPIKTLSAAGLRGLRDMLRYTEAQAPLRRNVTPEDVGHAALLHVSTLGRGITGEIIHVDAGYHTVGAPRLEEDV